jgi:glycosyltransferase involved in cell wall biosynthesis
MPRFARMLANGMRKRGHIVEMWMPKPRFYNLPLPTGMRKWMGYIDQYCLFPAEVLSRLRHCPVDTLFVFSDQALGPWVPLVSNQRHVIHCHDFLAQRSALGEIPENLTSWSGRYYQTFIRIGYSRGKNFISVSQNTRNELTRFLPSIPLCSEVVYNGLNQPFTPYNLKEARALMEIKFNLNLANGYLLHVGGNQWYKNRLGVIEIYEAWRSISKMELPLVMIGAPPNASLLKAYAGSSFKADIHLLCGIEDEFVRLAYAGASVFLFPSLAEGFGWPIAEAMASGCPVITTNEAPMTEVAGKAGFLIPRRPDKGLKSGIWAVESASVVDKVLNLSSEERNAVVESSLLNAKRFDAEAALDRIEAIYQNILSLD